METLSICLLASGGLGLSCLEYILSKNNTRFHSVFTDKKSGGIINFCKKNAIPCFAGNPCGDVTADFRSALTARPDIILSINYLF